MVELSNAKLFGGIGAILLLIGGLIPNAGPIISIIGLVLVFIAVKTISDLTKDQEIFRNFLYYFVFLIIAIVSLFAIILIAFGSIGGISWLTSIETAEITDFSSFWSLFGELIIGAIVGLFVAWIFAVIGSIYLRKSYKAIAKHTEVKLFETTGTLYLVGAVTAILIIGLLILFIARIIEIIAFFSLPDKLPAAGKDAERRCPSCGRIIPEDATVCPYCGKDFKIIE